MLQFQSLIVCSQTLQYQTDKEQRQEKAPMKQTIKQQHNKEQSSSQSLQKFSISDSIIQKQWNGGHWSLEQNMKCVAYFEFNKIHLHSKLKMKESKFFKQMSIFVDTRSPIQCRSQCQKLLRKYKTFYNVIQSFKQQYDHSKFNQEYETFSHNPLIRFKNSIQMVAFQKQAHISKDISIQTDRSFLQKKSEKKRVKIQEQQNQPVLNNFPFLKEGWWL